MPLEARVNHLVAAQSRTSASLAKIVVRAFNTWSFKREQPSDVKALEDAAEAAIMRAVPVSFVMYWGKGPRNTVGHPESQCIGYWDSLANRISAAYPPGSSLTLLLTDTHAQLNGHIEKNLEQYFSEVSTMAKAAGHFTERLSQVVSRARQALTGPTGTSAMPAHMHDLLIASAAKWYRGSFDSETAAKQYFLMNMEERDAVELAYPNSIFVTFNNSQHRHLFPQSLPVFYMYSVRKGCAVKPWFMDNDHAATLPHLLTAPEQNGH